MTDTVNFKYKDLNFIVEVHYEKGTDFWIDSHSTEPNDPEVIDIEDFGLSPEYLVCEEILEYIMNSIDVDDFTNEFRRFYGKHSKVVHEDYEGPY